MNELKTKLVFNAVPNPEPLEEPADVENEDNTRQHSDYEMHQGSCSPPAREPVHSSPDTSLPTDLTPRKRKLTQRINEQKLKLAKQRKKLWRMRHLATKKPDVKAVATEAVKHMSPKCGTLFGMQLLHKPFTPWTEAERRLSLSLFYKSPAAYDHLRREVGMKLPSKKIIQKWVSEMDIKAGTETKLFEHLVEKVKTMDDSCRDCVLVFDEMSVRKCLSYCAKYDVVEGYEDFGSLGRTSKVATQALMFLVRGLRQKWKLPVAYFTSCKQTKSDVMKQLLFVVLEKLFTVGLKVRCIVCDQGSNNRSLVRDLCVTT
ncbi:uncharacterized protein LOC124795347 [Schistocerca piceifrons]|uniref:uncharacterized protein LOC124795347 n=1 Tax=Schistocerca piceifrons TaxID=274613 RepID=UPI001F5F574B|nr:uncharacterized protein LOC124795347 [Schistocerca piceifrons]